MEYSLSRSEVLGIGSILGIINPLSKRIVLASIVGYRREDLLSAMNIPVTTMIEDPSTIQTPLILHVELLAEARIDDDGSIGEPQPPVTPLEPGSPVIVPRSQIIKKLLGIPEQGVLLGYLVTGSSIRRDVDVRLPLQALYHHLLVIGTTGSGKTVFLKNMALSIHYEYLQVKPLVIAFDLQGDYLSIIQENPELGREDKLYTPLDKLTVITPITNTLLKQLVKDMNLSRDIDKIAEDFGEKLILEYIGRTFRDLRIREINTSLKDIDNVNLALETVDVKLEDSSGRCLWLTLIPWGLRYLDVRSQLGDFIPVFTDQARLFLTELLEKTPGKTLREVISNSIRLEHIAKDLKVHRGTVENILRGLIILERTGLFDNRIVREGISHRLPLDRPILWIAEPDYDWLFNRYANVLVVDLRWANMYASSPYTQTVVVYRILERIFEWKDKYLREGVETKPTIILVDEAHNYFPQSTREAFSKDLVESMVNKMTRLGRIRRMGVIFATHQPQDLNSLVIQLTNTKIAFRSDKQSLEAIGLQEHYNTLRGAPSGYALLSTYAIRIQKIFIQVPPPQTSHQKP